MFGARMIVLSMFPATSPQSTIGSTDQQHGHDKVEDVFCSLDDLQGRGKALPENIRSTP
jgi:hypothetical protein